MQQGNEMKIDTFICLPFIFYILSFIFLFKWFRYYFIGILDILELQMCVKEFLGHIALHLLSIVITVSTGS